MFNAIKIHLRRPFIPEKFVKEGIDLSVWLDEGDLT